MVVFSDMQHGFANGEIQSLQNSAGAEPALAESNNGESFCDRMIKSTAEFGRVVFGYPDNPSALITSQPCTTHYLDCLDDLRDD